MLDFLIPLLYTGNMKREQKRKVEAEIAAIVKKAKQDMQKWLETLDHEPTKDEALAYQQGYLAGINRAVAASNK